MKITPLKNTVVCVNTKEEAEDLYQLLKISDFKYLSCIQPNRLIDINSFTLGFILKESTCYILDDYEILTLKELISKFTHRKLEDMQVGDILITCLDEFAFKYEYEVLDVYANSFLYRNTATMAEYISSFKRAQTMRWKFKDQPETITIEGKTYDKEKVLKALENLGEIE